MIADHIFGEKIGVNSVKLLPEAPISFDGWLQSKPDGISSKYKVLSFQKYVGRCWCASI